MKKWLKGNWFKIGCLIIGFIIASSFFVFANNYKINPSNNEIINSQLIATTSPIIIKATSSNENSKLPTPIQVCKERVSKEAALRVYNAEASKTSVCLNPSGNTSALSVSTCLKAMDGAILDLATMKKEWIDNCNYDPNFVPYKWGDAVK